MILSRLTARTLTGGVLGMVLAFRFAQIFSQEFAKVFNQELFPLYSTLSFWRYLTGYFPNFFSSGLENISWGIFFFSSWLMLWRFDSFFANAKKIQDEEVHETYDNADQSNVGQTEETVCKQKEESNNQSEKDNSEHEEENESNDSLSHEEFSERDEHFFEILGISKEAPRDFNGIKSVYRRRIAQYHPDKVSAMGPEIKEVAEQKAKEINEAYEYFRKKLS